MFARIQAWLLARMAKAESASVVQRGNTKRRELAGPNDSGHSDTRRAAREAGAAAESEALAHLQAIGLKLIQRNYLARGGELDLVMQQDMTLVFIEVRYRTAGNHGDGVDSVSVSKQRRLLAAARQFVAEHPQYARWTSRFDVLALGAGGLRWVRNAIVVDGAGW